MPSLIHLSDLHFGPANNTHLVELVLSDITELHPDAVVVSGDFTMRARHKEYGQARAFLDKISTPILTIPGNHDQPIFQPLERLTRQYARYKKYINKATDSTLAVNDLFILGLNDNRPILPGGFWSRPQRVWLEWQLTRAPRAALKVIATHHQFSWDGKWRPAGFWYPSRALEFLARGGVELVLNGHTHVPTAEQTPQGIVIARAGTATSARTRNGSSNSYNLIMVDSKQFSIFVRYYDEHADAFVSARAFSFPRFRNLV